MFILIQNVKKPEYNTEMIPWTWFKIVGTVGVIYMLLPRNTAIFKGNQVKGTTPRTIFDAEISTIQPNVTNLEYNTTQSINLTEKEQKFEENIHLMKTNWMIISCVIGFCLLTAYAYMVYNNPKCIIFPIILIAIPFTPIIWLYRQNAIRKFCKRFETSTQVKSEIFINDIENVELKKANSEENIDIIV